MPEQAKIEIASTVLGAGHPPVFWPDIDVYFRRDETQARRLIDAIAEAGGGFLKGAILHRADIALPGCETSYFDHVEGKVRTREYRAIMEEMVVPLAQLSRILGHARNAGLNLVLSVYDQEGVEFAVAEGACAIKIPSSNITHKPLIGQAARAGLPVVIDTGRSSWAEIARAVGWASEVGIGERLLLQHSPPGPPADAKTFHMRMLPELADCFDVPVGLSDHHPGLDMIPVAIALGACVIEKGLVATADEAGIDRAHALPASRLKETVAVMQETFSALGQRRRPDAEVPANVRDRMGCIAARPLKAGQIVRADDIAYAFPPEGLSAEYAELLIGTKLVSDIPWGAPFPPSLIGKA
ncbi:N-acetylneuraminate synthase family protein [Hoeflea sp.]|uniref:N-acetylneuraminate synthase family protein n=1 Tax=Hoeflea sp. TaxID=1940281 RepID=UPI00374A58EA